MFKKQLGVGLYSLAGVYGTKDLAEVEKMLLQARELGVRYFDVADQYGPAEDFLGRVLKPYRSDLLFASKVGITPAGGRDCSYEYIQNVCRQSLKRLSTDYLDLYQVHFHDPNTPVEETVQSLEKLKKDGLIREYGLGHLPYEVVCKYLQVGDPRTLLLEISLVASRSYEKYRDLCSNGELELIAMGAAGRGLLTGKVMPGVEFEPQDIRNMDPLFHRSLSRSALRILAKVQEIALQYQKTPVQVALNWVLSLPKVSVVLMGPSSRLHLEENLGALGWEITQETREELECFLKQENKRALAERREDIKDILKNPLPEEKKKAFADIVYVLDGLVEMGRAEEKEIIPFFQKALSWYRGVGEDELSPDFLQELREKIK